MASTNASPPAIPSHLCEQTRRGNTVLFVGAGLSRGAGLPDWEELIKPLAQRIDYTGTNLLKAAQYFEDQKGRYELTYCLRKSLDVAGVEPTCVHDLLVQLPCNVVYTTNFDNLLERSYRKAGRRLNVVVKPVQLPYWDETRVNLVKLHGTLEQPESILITEDDYYRALRSNQLMFQQLSTLLATKTLLLIGYSVNDPDFNQIYIQLGMDLGPHQPRPYLVTFDSDRHALYHLRRQGYEVIVLPDDEDRNARLAEWLRALIRKTDASASQTPQPQTPPAQDANGPNEVR